MQKTVDEAELETRILALEEEVAEQEKRLLELAELFYTASLFLKEQFIEGSNK